MLVSGVYGVVGMNFTVLKEKLKKGREVYVAVCPRLSGADSVFCRFLQKGRYSLGNYFIRRIYHVAGIR